MIEIIAPDDFHHHLRDGSEVLSNLLEHITRQFSKVIVMPNLQPPVRTVSDARSYKDRIMASLPKSISSESFTPLMTLYLTDTTTCDDIDEAIASKLIHAVKLYPAGATTNSEFGVTSISKVKHVLKRMEEVGLPLLVHGEVVDPTVDVFDREREFITQIMKPLIQEFPQLRVVMEHITTSEAVDFITNQCPENVVATITAHHLLYNRSDIFRGGVSPHMYCLPILKRETHRKALLQAATSGNPKFFIGTDSAPHVREKKETSCGCAGIYTAHAAIELYTEAFDSVNALDKLEGFTSIYGQQFYRVPINTHKIKLIKEEWTVPSSYPLGATSTVVPLRADQKIAWKIVS